MFRLREAFMTSRFKSGWLLGATLAVLVSLPGGAFAQHAGAHAGFGGFRGGVSHYSGGYRYGGYGWRGGYGWGGGWGWRGGYYGGWPYFWGALGYGLFFSTLPYAYSTYWWDGVPYYYANNNYYQWDTAANAYVTVAPPAGLASTAPQGNAPSAPQGQMELFAYPRNHQSAEQQARDRSECDQWAATQATHTHADHLRAQAACLEGRGYSVR
jgi:hypothetical protein